jgi:hypothetical protein
LTFLKELAAGNIQIKLLDEKFLKLCSTLMLKDLENEEVVKLYTVIDNCFTKEHSDEEDIRKDLDQKYAVISEAAKEHMKEIVDILTTEKKIFSISSLDGRKDIAETMYNLDVYIIRSLCARLIFASDSNIPNDSDDTKKALEELRLTLLHEMSHIKRIKYLGQK